MRILKEIKDHPLVCFTFLWAGASYFEQLQYYHLYGSMAGQIDLIITIGVLCRPSCLLSLLLLALSNCLVAAFCMQSYYSGNHTILENLINCSILAVFGFCFIRRSFDPEDIYQCLAVLMRYFLIGIYFWAFWAKLNTDFLDSRYSCAVVVLDHICKGYPLFHWILKVPQANNITIWGAIILEGLFPLLFILRQTRYWSIAAGLIYHLFLGLDPVDNLYSFSFLILFLYYFFLPDQGAAYASNLISRYNKSLEGHGPWIGYVPMAGVLYFLAYLNWINKGDIRLGIWIWLIPYVFISVIYLIGLLKHAPSSATSFKYDFSLRYKFLWIFVGLFLFNAISPYVGLKTQGGWVMYSNLRIFSGKPNHLIMPASLIVFKQDMVRILDSDSKSLMYFARNHYLLTEFEFRRTVQQIHGDLAVHCIYQGKEIFLYKNGQGASVSDLLKPIPWFEGTFLHFKPEFDGEHNCYCIS